MILVTGSTGTNGGALVEELVALGAPVRAMVHTPQKAGSVEREGVEAVVADFDAPETLDAALEGADRAFLVTPPDPRQVEWERNFVDAANRAGVRHVVKLSVLGADEGAPVRFGRVHAESERHLEESGLAYTILRPGGFMQNSLAYAGSIASEGRFYAPLAEAKMAWIDVRDIAAVAARTLTEDGHEGKTYELTGPRAISNREIAEKLSAATGKPVEHVEVSLEDAREGMVGAGLPEWLADGLVELNREVYEPGYAADVTGGVAEVTGREPRGFEEFARDHAGAFAGTGV
ncbi:MAG TPA: SDR family oxidoreductase [Rubrobacter sp.]|nr:SDR family oxidoreductase [Rubrobacter sp.]